MHLIRFLRGLGLVEAAKTKRIVTVPEVIWRSPRDVVAAYLAGLFEADGAVNGTQVTLTTKHHAFAMQVQRLLTAFGVESSFVERWNTAKAGGPTFRSFTLALRRAASDVFAKEIGFLSARKRAALEVLTSRPHSNAYRPMRWQDEIVSIDRCWLIPVDIQVEGEEFAAAGFVSHNSRLKCVEMAALGVPWVASPRDEYTRLHRDYQVGWLAERPKNWYRQLARVTADTAMRNDMSVHGRDVAAKLTIEGNAWRWMEAWEHAYRLQRQAAASAFVRT